MVKGYTIAKNPKEACLAEFPYGNKKEASRDLKEHKKMGFLLKHKVFKLTTTAEEVK